jgi:hypothetical protein
MPEHNESQKIAQRFKLPPLILHPFSSVEDSCVLVESSRASLMMQGLLPASGQSNEELDHRLLRGRYAELRMLFYVGKDLTRWLDQCNEVVSSHAALAERSLVRDSFVPLLVDKVPVDVRRKLQTWGVVDYAALFRRALGLHMIFAEPPQYEILTSDFLRRYHRYVDQWFETRLSSKPISKCDDSDFTYELYASGEYTQLLEQTWNG